MAVKQLSDGRWIVNYREPGGAAKKKYFGRGLDAETAAHVFDESLKIRTPKKQTRRGIFFFELIQSYATAKSGLIAKTTLQNFLIKMDRVVLPGLGRDIQAPALSPVVIDQYVEKRLKSVKRTTVAREIDDIQAVLNWSVKRRYISANPIAGYEKPKRDDAIIRPPSASESRAMIEASRSVPHLYRAIALSYFTGLRPGSAELFGLKWTDVDFDGWAIRITSAKKGGAPFRDVPIPVAFMPVLKQWFNADKAPDGYLITWAGRPIKSIKKAFKSAKQRAGITRRIRPYDFRHAFASTILKGGGDLKTTSAMLGHTRTDTTTRIYQHIDDEMKRAAVEKLPDILINPDAPEPDAPRPDAGVA